MRTEERTEESAAMITRPEDAPEETDFDLAHCKELERFPVADGYVIMAEQRRRRIGFAAVGRKAWETLNKLLSLHGFSTLETYRILGGDLKNAPDPLVSDHVFRYRNNPTAHSLRSLPSLDQIVDELQPMAAFSQSVKVGRMDAPCSPASLGEFSTPCLEFFRDYFYTHSESDEGISWAEVGANVMYGEGIWIRGDANLTLGPTTAGVAVVCFCNEHYDDVPRVVVQESLGQGLWIDWWSLNPDLTGSTGLGYGIKFGRPNGNGHLRRIRLLVRENEQNEGRPFSWCGSF